MRKLLCVIGLMCAFVPLHANPVLSLDSCRALAIQNNKTLQINREKVKTAAYQRKAAFTNYLPSISATGGYMYTSQELSLLNGEQKAGLGHLGSAVGEKVQPVIQQLVASGAMSPQTAGALANLMPGLAGSLNELGNSLTDALRTDTRNIFLGAVTLTQPIYMGGKIVAYNKITRYAEELAKQQQNSGLQEVLLSTDQVYWQIVSLANKKRLAEGYLQLLQKLDGDVEKMIAEGVATKADGLTVKVKVNEAEMTLTKVDDGLNLSKMLLCQLCGLDLSEPITLKEEQEDELNCEVPLVAPINMENVYATRPEIRSLELASKIYQQKVNVTRAEYLPSVALTGGYLASSPSLLNGFEKKFKGMWNVGVMVSVPIWHWGQGIYKTKAAKGEARIAEYNLSEAKEKIELQVKQSAFQVNEAAKKLIMANRNMEKADENLRYANLGFEEGVIPTSNVLEAHTAWLKAKSEKIDAQIDVKLTEVYLKKTLGTLGY